MSEARRATWQVTELWLPLAPFAFELIVRSAFLRSKVWWWELPNIGTLLVTMTFFCLSISSALASTTMLDSDDEFLRRRDSLKSKFLSFAVFCACAFGGLVGVRTGDQWYGDHRMLEQVARDLCILVTAGFIYVLYEAIAAARFLRTP